LLDELRSLLGALGCVRLPEYNWLSSPYRLSRAALGQAELVSHRDESTLCRTVGELQERFHPYKSTKNFRSAPVNGGLGLRLLFMTSAKL
jgi:hypothetical protein